MRKFATIRAVAAVLVALARVLIVPRLLLRLLAAASPEGARIAAE